MTTPEAAAAAERSDAKRAAARERPIMRHAELHEHYTGRRSRDYSESCDGYEDMEAEERRGWRAVPGWGRDGWDLGEWPYVVVYFRERDGKFELMTITEGDRDEYSFDSEPDRSAATDYLFLWHAAGRHWAPLSYDDKPKLDSGELDLDPKWRGPYRSR